MFRKIQNRGMEKRRKTLNYKSNERYIMQTKL